MSRVGVVGDLLVALERKSLDYRMARYRGGRMARGTAPSDVVIVAVDEKSLGELGRFPLWPRAYHARLVDTLAARGVSVVAFDLLFAEPDTLPAAVRAARVEEILARVGGDPATVERILGGWGGDRALAEALRRAGNVVLATAPGAAPVPVLSAAAAGLGHVSMAPDPDGMLRRVPTSSADGFDGPPLALAAVRAVGRPISTDAPVAPAVADALTLDLLGPRETFLTLSFTDVLHGRVAPGLLEGRVVFVGATAPGLGDVFATPFGEDFPGVEAHATLAYQTLHHRRVEDAGSVVRWVAGVVPGLVGAVFLFSVGPVASAVGALGAVGGYVLASFETYAQAGIAMPFAFPLLSWALTVLLAGAYRYGAEERRRRDIQRAFGHYVAPEVVEEIAQQPGALKVGGQAREITVGFVDIRGFTGLAERMDPEALAHFLHAFFTVVEDEIHKERGTVDKYIGDAVMMIFGAPNTLDDGPARACRAALGILDAVAAHAPRWREWGVEDLRVGVGLETGVAVVGNVGSQRRFDYTALGDTVNVASRLQDLNKELGTSVVVGPGTRAAAGDTFRFASHGTASLRGRPAPLSVYELLGEASSPAHEEPSALQ